MRRGDEIVIGCNALRGLPAGPPGPVAQLTGGRAEDFLRAYARDLLGVVLPVLWTCGIGLEAHLQNTMIRVGRGEAGPEYRGLVFRDFSGLHLHRGRFAALGRAVPARPGALTVTDDVAELRDKAHYCAVFGNLDGSIGELAAAGADRARLWGIVGEEVAELVARHGGAAVPGDVAALRAPALRRKAFAAMAVAGGGDRYVGVPNPLAARRGGLSGGAGSRR